MNIESIVNSLTAWGKQYRENKPETFYFSDAHKFRCEVAERLSYHAVFDTFPEKLIGAAAPNEDQKEYDYRKKNYKQKTKSYWDKALAATNRIFNEQNYSIDWKDDKIKDYFTYTYPVYGDYVQWFIDLVHPYKYADPGAVLVVKPAFIPGDFNEEGEFVVNQAEEITPVSEIYCGRDVFVYKPDYVLVLTKEFSQVKDSGRAKNTGLVFELYDDMAIYKIIQVGDKKDYTFEIVVYYEHLWEQIPAWALKGIPKYDPDEQLYFSHFSCAIPNLDEAVILNSTSFAVTNKIAFPTRWYYEDSCGNCSGHGWTENYEDHTKIKCSDCGGTGKKFTWTFGKDYIIPMPDNQIQQDTTTLPTPPFGTSEPPVETIKLLDEKAKYLSENAFITLNIHVTGQPTGVTATEVEDDKDELISFLLKISKEEFYLLEESIDAHTWMRWGKEDIVEVKEPNEFRVRSSADLTEELKTAIESKQPQPYIYNLLQEGIKQRFKSDTQLDDIVRIAFGVDPMAALDNNTVQQLANTGVVDKWRVTLHYFIYNFIYTELEKNDKFLEGDIETIKPVLEASAKAMTVTTTNKATDILSTL